MIEQEAALALAEKELVEAKTALVKAKRLVMTAEDAHISCKLARDRAKEDLRQIRARTPKQEPSKRDQEIEEFRKKYPELVAWAYQRDHQD